MSLICTQPLAHPVALGLTDARGMLSRRSGPTLPVNTVAPAVSGTAYPLETLTASNGTWSGSPSPSFTYQWYVNSVLRSGATNATFQPALSDIGLPIYCRVTATNAAGSQNANSNTVTCWHPNQITAVARFWMAGRNAYNSISPNVLAGNGQTVRRWDGILSGTQADQATGVNQPIYRSTGQSGNPTLEFDGANDFFSLPSNSDVFQSKSQGYILAGVRDTNRTGGSTAHPVVIYTRNGATASRLALFTRESSAGNVFAATARRQDGDAVALASTTSDANYNVLGAYGDWANGFVRLLVNGSVVASTALAAGSGSTSNTTSDTARIGADASGTVFFPGHMVAVCVVNASLTATQLSQINRYIGLLGGRTDIPLI